MENHLIEIVKQFIIKDVKSITLFGNGLINASYKVETQNGDRKSYLLQKINHNIFKDVEGLSDNIQKITDHIRKKLIKNGESEIDRKVLTPIGSQCNKAFYKDDEGNYWRMFLFIDDTKSFEQMKDAKQAAIAGKAFGQFHKLLSDYKGEPLCEVLPGFHNTPMRIDNLKKCVEQNPVGRLEQVKEEVDFLLSKAPEYSKIVEMGSQGILPERIVHQDTKFNNVLLDKDDNILCVIDLDTVMPGYVCIDVGDAIRTGANTAKEDEKDLDKVSFRLDIFEGFIKGFVAETNSFLTKEELETLAFGPKLLTYEQAVRFLHDYIDGDNYYKTEYADHNLVRARTQIKLLKCMDEKYEQMEKMVKQFS